jgi:hypothetical protein
MYYSTDGTNWTSAGDNFKTSFAGDGDSNGFASAPGITVSVSNKTLSVSLDPGSSLYLAWNYSVTSGSTTSSAQALGIDDVTIVANQEAEGPTISVDPASLTGFSYVVNSGPSSEKSFSLNGSNLTSNLTVSIDSDKHFEISSTSGENFGNSLSYTPSSGSVSATVYVRMKAGLAPGDYNNENIVCTSEGATSQNVTCSGTVLETQPPVLHITGTLNKFTMEQGTPSVSQSYNLYGENLTEDISITPPSGYQLSQDNINWVSSLSLAPDFSGTISVRLNGNDITSYNGNIVHTSGTAEANLAVSGIVFEPTPTNLLLLDNFYYDTGLALKDTRWSSHSGTGTNTITVQDDNLGYEGYPSVAGKCISLTGSGEDVNRTFTAQTANSVYASFLVNVTSATTAGDYFIHFGPQTIGSDFRGRVFVKKNTANALSFGLSNYSGTPVWTDFNYSLNTTYLFVLRYDILTGTSDDVAHLYINPPIKSNEPTTFTLTATDANTDTANIGSIAIRQGSNTPTLKLDGIRVATSWENLFEISEQPPLPVVLTSFMAAISNQNYINLTWITQTETGMMGYYIMRNNVNDLATAQIVSPLIPAINSSQPKAYLYTDYEVTESGTYYYWLQANDLDGTIYVLSFVSIEYNVTPGSTTPSIPTVTELNNVYPNPFNPQLFIPFSLANKSEVKIIIYNTRGQVVKDFALGEKNAGNYRIEWDGTDNNGKAVPNGIYCIRMIAGKDYYQTKAILMK